MPVRRSFPGSNRQTVSRPLDLHDHPAPKPELFCGVDFKTLDFSANATTKSKKEKIIHLLFSFKSFRAAATWNRVFFNSLFRRFSYTVFNRSLFRFARKNSSSSRLIWRFRASRIWYAASSEITGMFFDGCGFFRVTPRDKILLDTVFFSTVLIKKYLPRQINNDHQELGIVNR